MKSQKNPAWTVILRKPERTSTEEELSRLALEIAQTLKPGDRVFLEGELGAGKSRLARALLEAMGEKTFRGSPTYPICLTYAATKTHPVIHHLDWYRLKRSAELESGGLLETLWDTGTICLIEWGSKFTEVKDEQASEFACLEICITDADGGKARNYRLKEL